MSRAFKQTIADMKWTLSHHFRRAYIGHCQITECSHGARGAEYTMAVCTKKNIGVEHIALVYDVRMAHICCGPHDYCKD